MAEHKGTCPACGLSYTERRKDLTQELIEEHSICSLDGCYYLHSLPLPSKRDG